MIRIVGLCSGAGGGKTTVADFIASKCPNSKVYALADPLKDLTVKAFDLRQEQVRGTQAQKEEIDPRYGLSGRQLLQRIGDGVRVTWGPNFWVDRLFERINVDKIDVAVVSDVRYINEAILIREVGAVWRLDSPDRETSADATHPSESQWFQAPCDYVIAPPERGLDLLYAMVSEVAKASGLRGFT